MFYNRNSGICARLVIAAGALGGILLPVGIATANAGDVRVSISIGGHARPAPARPIIDCEREHDYAGTLTIDGHTFRITTRESVAHQVLHAFEHMGYRASCTGRSVRITTLRGGPEVCWRNGEYTLQFRERRGSVSVIPVHDCDDDDYGAHYRYCFDRGHDRYYTYHEVHTAGHEAGITWTAVGASTFVEHDHDDDHIGDRGVHGRSDDADFARGRYMPDERRHANVGRASPEVAAAPSVDLRKRTTSPAPRAVAPGNSRQEPKRSIVAKEVPPVGKPTILPSDRFGGVKPAAKTDAPKANDVKARSNGPAAKQSESKRTKW